MNKKHIRTAIISALVLMVAIITIINIDIEPANQYSQSSEISSPVAKTQKPQTEPSANEILSPAQAQKTESGEMPSATEQQPAISEASANAEQQTVTGETQATIEQQTTIEKTPSATESETETAKELPVEEPESEFEIKQVAGNQKYDNKESLSEEKIKKNNITKKTNQSDEQAVTNDIQTEDSIPQKPQDHFCTIEIRCDTVKDTSKLENQAVAPFVPKNGVILATTEIKFEPGESVFDILLRATMERNIHMEYRSENAYTGGRYIEGINYLYEMDAGPLSGWMYKVNSKFPNYGCGSYEVKDGDAIVWIYSCDLGADVGDNSSW